MKHLIERENYKITIEGSDGTNIILDGVYEYILLGSCTSNNESTDFSYTYGSNYSLIGRLLSFIDFLKQKVVLKENA